MIIIRRRHWSVFVCVYVYWLYNQRTNKRKKSSSLKKPIHSHRVESFYSSSSSSSSEYINIHYLFLCAICALSVCVVCSTNGQSKLCREVSGNWKTLAVQSEWDRGEMCWRGSSSIQSQLKNNSISPIAAALDYILINVKQQQQHYHHHHRHQWNQ